MTGELQNTVCRPTVGRPTVAIFRLLLPFSQSTNRWSSVDQSTEGSRRKTTPSCGKTKDPGNEIVGQFARVAFQEAVLHVYLMLRSCHHSWSWIWLWVLRHLCCLMVKVWSFPTSRVGKRVVVGLKVRRVPVQAKVIKSFLSRCGEVKLVCVWVRLGYNHLILYRCWWNTRISPFSKKSFLHRAQWRYYFYLSCVRILMCPWLPT